MDEKEIEEVMKRVGMVCEEEKRGLIMIGMVLKKGDGRGRYEIVLLKRKRGEIVYRGGSKGKGGGLGVGNYWGGWVERGMKKVE